MLRDTAHTATAAFSAIRPVYALMVPTRTPGSWPAPRSHPSLQQAMHPGSPAQSAVIGPATPEARRSSSSLLTWDTYSRPAFPGVSSHTAPSATESARNAPHGVPVDACKSPKGFPVLPRCPSSMNAGANSPAGTVRCTCRFSSQIATGVPLTHGGAPRCLFRGLLGVRFTSRSAWSLGSSTQPDSPECFSPCRYLREPLRPLPAGSAVAEWE